MSAHFAVAKCKKREVQCKMWHTSSSVAPIACLTNAIDKSAKGNVPIWEQAYSCMPDKC